MESLRFAAAQIDQYRCQEPGFFKARAERAKSMLAAASQHVEGVWRDIASASLDIPLFQTELVLPANCRFRFSEDWVVVPRLTIEEAAVLIERFTPDEARLLLGWLNEADEEGEIQLPEPLFFRDTTMRLRKLSNGGQASELSVVVMIDTPGVEPPEESRGVMGAFQSRLFLDPWSVAVKRKGEGSRKQKRPIVESLRECTLPSILVDQHTLEGDMYLQLLLWGTVSKYVDIDEAFQKEFERLVLPRIRRARPREKGEGTEEYAGKCEAVCTRLLEHLLRNLGLPYEAGSFPAYLKKLVQAFWVEEESTSVQAVTQPLGDELTVRQAAQESGLSVDSIYRFVKRGSIPAIEGGHWPTDQYLIDEAMVEELKDIKKKKDKRKAIVELATMRGKSKEAIKKWLQRNPMQLPDFDTRLEKWLGIAYND